MNLRKKSFAIKTSARTWSAAVGCGLCLMAASQLQAETITVGTWTAYDGETVTNASTANPSFEPGSSGTAGGGIYAAFNSPLLLNTLAVGGSITLSGSFEVSGTATANQGFRFGLFDSNGASNTLGWTGYLITSMNSDSPIVWERNLAVTTADYGTTGTAIASIGGNANHTGGNLGNGTYSFQQTITKTAATSLSIDASLVSTGVTPAYSVSISAVADNSLHADLDRFDRAGFIFAGGYSADAVSFSNITVTAVPEPSTYAMIAGATFLGFAAWRRRRN